MADIADRVRELQKNKTNLAQKAYREIKNDIIYCEFKPGEHLREQDLAEVLGMSRTPVREALKRLANEDLVEIKRGSGVYVKNITAQDLKDIYEVRRALECMAVKTAVNNIAEKELVKQEEFMSKILNKVKQGAEVEWEEVTRLDDELHSLIVRKSNNQKLKSFMEVIRQQIKRYQFLAALALDDIEITVTQHLKIIKLLREQRDVELLAKSLEEHISYAEEVIIKNVFA